MGKISYCSLEEAWGNTTISDSTQNEKKFDNTTDPIFEKKTNIIEKYNNNDGDSLENEEKIPSDKLVPLGEVTTKEDKKDLITNNDDIIEAYKNMQYSFEDKTIDLFVLFIMGIMIIYILDYFFNLGKKMK